MVSPTHAHREGVEGGQVQRVSSTRRARRGTRVQLHVYLIDNLSQDITQPSHSALTSFNEEQRLGAKGVLRDPRRSRLHLSTEGEVRPASGSNGLARTETIKLVNANGSTQNLTMSSDLNSIFIGPLCLLCLPHVPHRKPYPEGLS